MVRNYLRKLFSIAVCVSTLVISGCATSEYRKQAYAEQQTSRTMEYEFARVWRGMKDALTEFRIEESNESKGVMTTDWAYSTSQDKYVEIVVNQQPRRKYLQTRFKFEVSARKQPIGVLVDVKMNEEIERLKDDGSFQSWDHVPEPDTARAHELLQNIERRIQGGRDISS